MTNYCWIIKIDPLNPKSLNVWALPIYVDKKTKQSSKFFILFERYSAQSQVFQAKITILILQKIIQLRDWL